MPNERIETDFRKRVSPACSAAHARSWTASKRNHECQSCSQSCCFPFPIFYRPEPDEIMIFALAHHARHPFCWQSRTRTRTRWLQVERTGGQLLRHALYGGYTEYPQSRIEAASSLLFNDLQRQFSEEFLLERNSVRRHAKSGDITVPIVMIRRATKAETWIAISSPIANDVPIDPNLRRILAADKSVPLLCVNDLLIRRHLPVAISSVRMSLN